jgi:hypothetical protein
MATAAAPGAPTRHIILVRHGQYDEQRPLSRALSRPAGVPDRDFGMPLLGPFLDPSWCLPVGVPDRDFGMPLDEAFPRLDAEQTLTPLGRQQATATGRRIAEMLRGALQEEGREAHVRLHVSTLT